MADIAQEAWDGLREARSTPFTSWGFLNALETSGCATPETGWTARHLTLWRKGALIAAAPAYLKDDSDGDFSRDWEWASLASQRRLPFYPKLVLGVPFTPVTGQRLLIAPGEDAEACRKELVALARSAADDASAGAIEVLYCTEGEAEALRAEGFSRRLDFQYHWFNAGYRTTDDFLARFSSKQRNMLRREWAAPVQQGIEIRTVEGEELKKDPDFWAKTMHKLHWATVTQMAWGRRWLTQGFYQDVLRAMPDHFQIVAAQREGKVIAGAFNGVGGDRLWGRYWGCIEQHPFLHFNVCYYHSIQECIRRGIQLFEGGAGGEHKVARGFEPSLTYGAHSFTDARLEKVMGPHLERECRARASSLEQWRAESKLFRRPGPGATP
jgi:predicted N-acyltransferase